MSFKPGSLSQDDVLRIAHELGSSWKMVGRVLNVPDDVIELIQVDEPEVSEQCYRKCNCVVCVVITVKHMILRVLTSNSFKRLSELRELVGPSNVFIYLKTEKWLVNFVRSSFVLAMK